MSLIQYISIKTCKKLGLKITKIRQAYYPDFERFWLNANLIYIIYIINF